MKLSGYVSQYTPAGVTSGEGNYWLSGTTSTRGLVQEVSWGGYASSSTPMETAIRRCSTNGSTPPSAGNVTRLDQTVTSAGNSIVFYPGPKSGWTTAPTQVSGALFGAAWNAYGGVVRWLAAPGEEFDLAFQATIACVPIAGLGTSSYACVWSEL